MVAIWCRAGLQITFNHSKWHGLDLLALISTDPANQGCRQSMLQFKHWDPQMLSIIQCLILAVIVNTTFPLHWNDCGVSTDITFSEIIILWELLVIFTWSFCIKVIKSYLLFLKVFSLADKNKVKYNKTKSRKCQYNTPGLCKLFENVTKA